MKKIIFSLLFAAVLAAGIVACSSNEPAETVSAPQTEQATDGYAKLNSDLEAFSYRFAQEHPSTPVTRGFWNKLGHFLKADFTATKAPEPNVTRAGNPNDNPNMITILQIAIGASIDAWKKADLEIGNDDSDIAVPNFNDEMKNEIDNLYKDSYGIESNMGYYHNKVIANLAEKKPEVFGKDYSQKDLLKAISTELNALGLDTSDSNIEEADERLTFFNENILSESDAETFNNLAKYNPTQTQQIRAMETMYSTFVSTKKEYLSAYADSCVKMVQHANISDAEKAELESGISIGKGSSALWQGESNLGQLVVKP